MSLVRIFRIVARSVLPFGTPELACQTINWRNCFVSSHRSTSLRLAQWAAPASV